ncbi:MAG: 2-oxoacid:ferredoxin oxidoreductase subunit beta [bacterium]|nr:2-oxoacid:ferredoxin oxidoreductase subunit beta [bacterium]MBU1919019.1 2-oxoacid:ferredoxin oxidoreductase subunit beta [bacterium]
MSTAEKITEEKKITRKDFMTDQAVRWCPGCGDYAVLVSVQNALAQLEKNKDDVVFVSGIGCSSRFPYYVDTYGFHTIHGRAVAVATGVKTANPKLDVWVISGDGDSLSIGGNHFIHAIRRNIGLKYLVFNNEIYGLTKGQYSPTTKQGAVTKSSPFGSLEQPFNPASLCIGAESSFYARVTDTNPKMMTEIFVAAAKHKGTAFIEILQNCVIFNNKTHEQITGKEFRDDNQLVLKHGEPMIFGQNKDKGIVLDKTELKVVRIGENGITEADVLKHDAHAESPNLAFMLSRFTLPQYPVPIGIIRQVDRPAYEEQLHAQIKHAKEKKKAVDLNQLLNSGDTWEVD